MVFFNNFQNIILLSLVYWVSMTGNVVASCNDADKFAPIWPFNTHTGKLR